MRRPTLHPVAFACLLSLGCRDDKRPGPDASAQAKSALGATASAPPAVASDSGPPIFAHGGGTCRIDVGPLALDFVGAPTIVIKPSEIQVVGNDKGTAHIVTIAGGRASASGGRIATSSVPCAVARARLFCPGDDGKIHTGDRVVAQSRAGTKIAAAEIGGHAVVAYVTDKKTSEGVLQTAEVWSDDGKTTALSDEGNGATFVELGARDGEVVALTIDAHMGMTPIHARVLEWKGKLELGPDVVLMVAGNAETHTQGAIATRHDKGPSFALVPIAKDISAFGVAAIRVDDPPRLDAPVSWSLYDNGLDPAPIAATHDGARMFVARVRPAGKEAKAPRVLELGALDPSGSFTALATRPPASSIALASDGLAVWMAYASDVVHVERLVCP